MSSPVVDGVAKAVPDAIRGWGIYSLIAVFMVGGGWIATRAIERQHSLIESVCNRQLEALANKIGDARTDTKAMLRNQQNLVPIVLKQQEQIGGLIQALGSNRPIEKSTGYGP